MTTAYNLGAAQARANQDRSRIGDPGDGGTIKVQRNPGSNAYCIVSGTNADTRTLSTAAGQSYGDRITIMSKTTDIVVNGTAIGAGEHCVFVVRDDGAGAKEWAVELGPVAT